MSVDGSDEIFGALGALQEIWPRRVTAERSLLHDLARVAAGHGWRVFVLARDAEAFDDVQQLPGVRVAATVDEHIAVVHELFGELCERLRSRRHGHVGVFDKVLVIVDEYSTIVTDAERHQGLTDPRGGSSVALESNALFRHSRGVQIHLVVNCPMPTRQPLAYAAAISGKFGAQLRDLDPKSAAVREFWA